MLWFASGSEDFLMRSTKNTIEALKKHEFKPVFKEIQAGIRRSTGGITSMSLPQCSSSNATWRRGIQVGKCLQVALGTSSLAPGWLTALRTR